MDGVKFLPGGHYIKVRYYERYPPTSPSNFKLTSRVWTAWTENAEGVIFVNVPIVQKPVRRSGRGHASSASLVAETSSVMLAHEVIKKLDDLPRLDSI